MYKTLSRVMSVLVLLSVFAVMTGCTKYYSITDPSTSKTYYATKYKEKGSSLHLTDAKSGDKVIIQNAEISTMTKQQYEQATK